LALNAPGKGRFFYTFVPQPTGPTLHYDQQMKVLVYSASWCRDCREAKRFLEKHQISYTEIDIETNPGAAAEVVRHVGKRAIPQFVLDGKWIQPYRPGQGFLHREMSELFGVG
jgi:mycoredoxin